MNLTLIAIAGSLLVGCAQVDAPQPPPYGNYVLFEAASQDEGMKLLDALDPALAPASRRKLEAKGLAGDGPTMMIRFTGDCTTEAAFVAEVRAVVGPKGARNVRCTANLPGDG